MSDAQQGLPRYTGTGAFGKVADALNLHSSCIEDLDATGMVSNARYSGRGGSVTAKPRDPRGSSANHAGDFKRFAMRIAKDSDGNLMLFIGKGGVQVETSEATTRIAIAETKKALIEDGIVYIDYTKGAATLEYGTEISPEAEHYYVRIGKTSKNPDVPAEWKLPEQWLTTDAYLMLQGDSRVDDIIDVLPPDPVVTRDDGTIETKPDGTPVRSFADDYSFRCRVAIDGTTWRVMIQDGVVRGRLPGLYDPQEVATTTVDLVAGTDTHIFLLFVFTDTSATYQYVTNASATYSGDVHTPAKRTTVGMLTKNLNLHYESVVKRANYPAGPSEYTTVVNVNTTFETDTALGAIGEDATYGHQCTFRIASITWSNGVPSLRQRQIGDIWANFRAQI